MSRVHCQAGRLLLLIAAGSTSAAEPPPPLRLLVPAYFYPVGPGLRFWDRLIASSAKVPIVAIVNPASGPGKGDPAYTRLLDRAKKQPGLTLVGYVSTRYAKRPLADVKADLDRWLRLYPQIRGFFLDEQASAVGQVDYYAALYLHARKTRKLRLLVSNPGTVCAKGYLARPATDVACLFEAPKGFGDFLPPVWAKGYGAGHFAALAYQVKEAKQMREHVARARKKGLGYLYVTDGSGANPWDRLPAYWDEQVSVVKEVNGHKHR